MIVGQQRWLKEQAKQSPSKESSLFIYIINQCFKRRSEKEKKKDEILYLRWNEAYSK